MYKTQIYTHVNTYTFCFVNKGNFSNYLKQNKTLYNCSQGALFYHLSCLCSYLLETDFFHEPKNRYQHVPHFTSFITKWSKSFFLDAVFQILRKGSDRYRLGYISTSGPTYSWVLSTQYLYWSCRLTH